MIEYLSAMKHILNNGVDKMDRTGTGTRSVFGYQMRFDPSKGFPTVTTKKLALKAVKGELLWMLEGSGDERRLAEITHGSRSSEYRTVWTDNAQAPYWKDKAKYDGDLGRVYGVQWRHWQTPKFVYHPDLQANIVIVEEVDQLQNLINGIKSDPNGRRHILSAWNPGELDQMALPPCHVMAQFYVSDGKLSCMLTQRSADVLLGVPFNIMSYALLTHMIAQVCDLGVGDFVYSIGDLHLYSTHFEQAKEQLSRDPLPLPTLWLNPDIKDITKFTMDDIRLVNYDSHPPIKAPMAV